LFKNSSTDHSDTHKLTQKVDTARKAQSIEHCQKDKKMHCVALAKLLAILGFKTSVASHKPAGHVIYVQRIVCVHMTVTTPKGTSFSDPDSVVTVDPESGSGSRQARIIPSIKKCHVLEVWRHLWCMDVLFIGLRRNFYPNFACNFFPHKNPVPVSGFSNMPRSGSESEPLDKSLD
jgi:hypothetical protein